MLAAAPTQYVNGERYQFVGNAPPQVSLLTISEVQNEFNQLAPGATKVVAVGLVAGSGQAVIVLDWIGPTQAAWPTTATTTVTDLGPTSANPQPTVQIVQPSAPAAASSTGTYVAVGLGVFALGALAWYLSKRSLAGRTYAYEALENPIPRALSAGERQHPTGHETFASYMTAVRRYLETRNMATRKRAALIVDAQMDTIGRMWREGASVPTAVAHLSTS